MCEQKSVESTIYTSLTHSTSFFQFKKDTISLIINFEQFKYKALEIANSILCKSDNLFHRLPYSLFVISYLIAKLVIVTFKCAL